MLNIEAIKQTQQDLREHRGRVSSEEETKLWFIAPLLGALGYKPTDLRAETQTKHKGEDKRLDYYVFVNDKPVIIVECKKIGEPLWKHINQLWGYFSEKVRDGVKLGVLTDGDEYWFFTDSKDPNM